MRHFPKETRGCYYEDINTCCWLCACRMFLAVLLVFIQRKLRTIYNFLTSQDFPVWIALIFLVGFVTDLTYTFQVVYNDKEYFLVSETNKLLKFSYSTGRWYIYGLFAILLYSIMIILTKTIANPIVRGIFLVLGVAQVGTPLAWAFSWKVFIAFYLSLLCVVFYSIYLFIPKKKSEASSW